MRGLDYLGASSSQYGSLSIPVIMSKSPTEIRSTAHEVNVIRKKVEAREISDGVNANENLERNKETPMRRPTNSTLFSHNGSQTTQKRNPS